MKAELGHGFRGKHVVVEISNRVGVAGLALERLSQSIAAAELSQIFQTSELVKNLTVVGLSEFVINARREDVIARRRAHGSDERRNYRR